MGVACPHCGAANESGSAFCMGCGKALPVGGGPRVVNTLSGTAQSAAGVAAQSEELKKLTKQAFIALLAVGIVTTLEAGLVWVVGTGGAGAAPNERPDSLALMITIGMVLVFAGVFFGLAFWARKNPLPASIIGLALFGTIILLGAVVDPTSLAKGILIKIFVIAALIKGIQAGVKHRQLLKGAALA